MNNFNQRMQQFILITCLFLLSSISLFAQQNHGKLKGIITTSDGEPAAGVNVILKNSKYRTITNDNGCFELNRVKTNTYTLQVSLTGYETTQQEVIATENKTTSINFQLKVSNKELEEVVINNRKSILSKKTDYVARMSLSNLENPQVYSVIHKELLQEQVTVDISNAVRNSPGVIPINYPSGGFGVIFRGFSTGINARNGMETASGRSSVGIANVERIEIMKGPSGTLFGSSVSSFGGVVNLVTKKPFETTATEVSYTTGSFGINQLTADVNTPLNNDKTVLFRINLAVNKQKSFLDYGFNNYLTIAPSLTYKATEKLTFTVDAELFNSNNTRRIYSRYDAASKITNPKDLKIDYKKSLFHDDADSKTASTKFFTQAEYKLSNNWKSTTLFSFVGEDVEHSYQGIPTWISPTQVNIRASLYGPITNNYTNIQENINGEFSTGSIKHKILIGINYRNFADNFLSGASSATVPIKTIDITTDFTPVRKKDIDPAVTQTAWPSQKENTYSAYLADVINFTDKLSAMLSLRLDNFERKAERNKYSQTALAPKLGLVYEILKNNVSIFGNYMSGFQNAAPVEQPNNGGKLTLDPIYAMQYEGGIKVEAFNKKLSTTASYYNITIDNATRTDAFGFYTQDAKQVSKGFDFELIVNPFAGLNIIAGYAYNDNRYLKTDDISIEGNKASDAPENVINFWSSYTFQNKLKGLGVGFGGNFVDKSYISSDNVFYIPSYTILNATVFYDQPTWRIGVKLNNLTNKKYWDSWASSQAPTNILVNLTLRF